MSSKQLETIRA